MRRSILDFSSYGIILWITSLLWKSGVLAFTEPTWTGTRELTPTEGESIDLSYYVDQVQQRVILKLSAPTLGWIGFGLAEATTGSMPGSDIVTMYIDEQGTPIVEDRHVDWAAYSLSSSPAFYPSLDVQASHWSILEASEGSGQTSFVISRLLNTGDLDDRPIVNSEMRIIFAHGSSDFVGYHGSTRGAGTINFFEEEKPAFVAPADSPNNLTLRMGNFTNFKTDTATNYVCKSFNLAEHITNFANRHITALDVVLDPNSEQYVHHLLVHVCSQDQLSWRTPSHCTSPTGTVCDTLLYGWAVGGGPLVLPDVAGFLTGTAAGDARFLVLEMHYDNPAIDTNIVDDSGFIMYYTDQDDLRANSASSIVFGDPLLTFDDVPAGIEAQHYEAVCPGKCTERRLGNTVLTVFGSFLHMHSFGRQIYTRKHGQDETANQADFWNFQYQHITPVNYTISAGDQFNTHCTYDTTRAASNVPFYFGSEDEMCMDFVFYYPRVENFGLCGVGRYVGSITGSQLASFLGIPCSFNIAPGVDINQCSVNIPLDQTATVCGEISLDGLVFFPDDFDPLNDIALTDLLQIQTKGNEILGRYVLKQADYYDGYSFIEPSFGNGVALTTAAPSVNPVTAPSTDFVAYIGIGVGSALAAVASAFALRKLYLRKRPFSKESVDKHGISTGHYLQDTA